MDHITDSVIYEIFIALRVKLKDEWTENLVTNMACTMATIMSKQLEINFTEVAQLILKP